MRYRITLEPVQLRRDPFGRRTLYRIRTQKRGDGVCRWCGREAYVTGYYDLPRLWHYLWVGDTSSLEYASATAQSLPSFCSVRCWESYHS